MKLRFQVIEVGWEIDLDDNRHPGIRIGRRDWSAVLYDHPAESWQVIALNIAHNGKHGVRFEQYAGPVAESKLCELTDGELVLTDSALDTVANDLYEIGRKGAAKHWVGKTIPLLCDGRSSQEVR